MSIDAMMLGSIKYLRSVEGLGLGEKECDEQPDGSPPPNCGQRYFALHMGDWASTLDTCLEGRYGLELTITLRTPVAPKDRIGVAVLRELRRLALAAVRKLHMSDLARIQWNAFIPDTENDFVECLRFKSASRPVIRASDWFAGGGDSDTGVSMTLTFADALRIEVIENAASDEIEGG